MDHLTTDIIALLALAGSIVAFLIRLERRLVKIETLLGIVIKKLRITNGG